MYVLSILHHQQHQASQSSGADGVGLVEEEAVGVAPLTHMSEKMMAPPSSSPDL